MKSSMINSWGSDSYSTLCKFHKTLAKKFTTMKLLFFLFSFSIFSATATATADEFSYTVEYLQTPIEQTDLKEIINSSKWQVLEKSSFGISKQLFWIKLSLHNPADKKIAQVFEFMNPFLDYVTIYFADGRIEKKGQLLPFYKQEKLRLNTSFTASISPRSNQEIYIKIKTRGSLNVALHAFEPFQYLETVVENNGILMIFLGISLAMLIYNSMIFIFTKDKSYLYYVIFHFSSFVIQMQTAGLLHKYLFLENPSYLIYVFAVFMCIVNMFSLLFSMKFLSLNRYMPKTTVFLNFLLGLNFILLISIPFFYVFILYNLMLMLLKILLFVIALYMLFVKRTAVSKFYAAAWSFSLIGMILATATNIGLLSDFNFVLYGWQTASSIEMMLLSIGLAHHYKQLKNERDAAKIKILESEKKLMLQNKMASMGEMINNIAHQWRQPLASLNGIFICLDDKYSKQSLDQKSLDNYLVNAESLTTYMSNTIEDFTHFFSPKKEKECFLIENTLLKTQRIMESSLKQHKIELEIKVEGKLMLDSYPSELMQVLFTLINNARDAFVDKNIKEKRITLAAYQDQQEIIIQVKDNAQGLDKAIIDKIFDPYFTTKHQSQGTGLGLYIAKMVIEKSMYGSLSVFKSQQETVFQIELFLDNKIQNSH